MERSIKFLLSVVVTTLSRSEGVSRGGSGGGVECTLLCCLLDFLCLQHFLSGQTLQEVLGQVMALPSSLLVGRAWKAVLGMLLTASW